MNQKNVFSSKTVFVIQEEGPMPCTLSFIPKMLVFVSKNAIFTENFSVLA